MHVYAAWWAGGTIATAGVSVRIGGVGTFVAETKSEGHLLEVSNIADEVRERGHAYQNRVVSHGKMADSGAITPMMNLRKMHLFFIRALSTSKIKNPFSWKTAMCMLGRRPTMPTLIYKAIRQANACWRTSP